MNAPPPSALHLPDDPIARRQWRMDTLVGTLLMIGVIISLALVTAGLVWSYLRTGQLELAYHIVGMNFFQFTLATLAALVQGQFSPPLLVNAGIVVLMATPFLRVLASMVYFVAILKNAKYAVFTTFVLLVLTWSLFLRS